MQCGGNSERYEHESPHGRNRALISCRNFRLAIDRDHAGQRSLSIGKWRDVLRAGKPDRTIGYRCHRGHLGNRVACRGRRYRSDLLSGFRQRHRRVPSHQYFARGLQLRQLYAEPGLLFRSSLQDRCHDLFNRTSLEHSSKNSNCRRRDHDYWKRLQRPMH